METVIEWVKNNLTLVIAGAAVLILLIILIAVSASKAKKKRKSEKQSETVAKEENLKIAEENVCDADLSENSADDNSVDEKEDAQSEKEDVSDTDESDTDSEEIKQTVNSTDENNKVNEEENSLTKEETVMVNKKNTVSEKKTKTEGKTQKKVLKSVGKWTVEMKAAGEYMATLSANNGEVMLSSEIYTTEEGARSGIATIINCVANGKFVIYRDKNKNYYYKLKSAGNRLLCVGEIYKSKDQCLKAVETVKRIAAQATVLPDVAEGAKYVAYKPVTLSTDDIKKGLRGRWRVESTEEGNYCAKLYASNGQLMLATEEVSLRKSAEKAIEAVKKNSLAGNFIIDRDKFGRYYYKLRNAQKSVICIGEAYDSLESCINALESVRRFAATTPYNQE